MRSINARELIETAGNNQGTNKQQPTKGPQTGSEQGNMQTKRLHNNSTKLYIINTFLTNKHVTDGKRANRI